MPQPRSSPAQSSRDIAGSLGNILPSKDVFRVPRTVQAQNEISSNSPVSSGETSSTITKIPDPSQSRQSPATAMHIDEAESMQYLGQQNLIRGHSHQNFADHHKSFPVVSDLATYYQNNQNELFYSDSYGLTYAPHYPRHPSASISRLNNSQDLSRLPSNVSVAESYPPSAYQIELQNNRERASDSEAKDYLGQIHDNYEHHYDPCFGYQDYSGYLSPYSDFTRASTPNDLPPKYPLDPKGEETVIDKEQPYAQLIYHALLKAPGHTMVLREIYAWFKNNTDKASASETKGWQNSIRHNLSMNGAFEKVDQPGEDSRKGCMWRLTADAIREGVKSTTRYRSKQPTKRGHHNHPQPQRQASGAKGGHAARRAANLRRSRRVIEYHSSDPYSPKSIPTSSDPGYLSETSTTFPSTPCYESQMDMRCGPQTAHADFGSPLTGASSDDTFTARAHAGHSLSQDMLIENSTYGVDPISYEPLFTNSPTPPTDGPLTPISYGGWNEEINFATPCIFEEMTYPEYAG